LIKEDFIEVVEAMFFNNSEIKLSENSLKMLRECNLKVFSRKKNSANIIKPTKISERKLIFQDEEMKQLLLVKNLLNDSKLAETQKRLLSRNLPQGITVMLHGHPGTGKTETVLQLARETGREIMKVDISQSKSVWFGQSEKIIKGIFTDYQTYSKECDRLPILLFNEADAIFSKRKEVSISSVAQTENTIQNIILEELESFEGLLFATTNLTMNLDSAFERRFLFKVEFRKPDVEIKSKIWQLKLPKLSTYECETLASRFDFTGGQIDNIVRKSEIQETIHGKAISFESIVEFCGEEGLDKKRINLGFINYS
jgi:SpoVK/Ycf46/Vps4 family AAA+-type ATPase